MFVVFLKSATKVLPVVPEMALLGGAVDRNDLARYQ